MLLTGFLYFVKKNKYFFIWGPKKLFSPTYTLYEKRYEFINYIYFCIKDEKGELSEKIGSKAGV